MKLRRILPLVLVLLASIGLTAPTSARADSPTEPATTNVFIHKLQTDISSGTTTIPNDGRPRTVQELSTALGAPVTPLPGVVFTYWQLNNAAGLADLNQMSEADLNAAYPVHTTLSATDATGTASAGALATRDNLGNPARYYFRETSIPPNVHSTLASPFILGLPLMNVEGTQFLTDVHLYPKNVTVYGKVDLAKVAGYGAPLPNASFRLYQGVPASPFDPANPGTEYGPKLVYTTDSTGHLTVSGLPYGDYYFVETQAPAGFMLDPAPVPFRITVSEATRIETVTKTNWIQPTIAKWAMNDDQASASAGYNDEFTWRLEPRIPGNIASYQYYTVTDVLDPALTYTGNLVVKVGTQTLTEGVHYTVSAPTGPGGTLQITFAPSQLSYFADTMRLDLINNTVITFTTKINTSAVMGKAISNNATVTYNDNISGPGQATSGAASAYTGGKVFKKVAENENGTPLPGAQFKVAYDSAGTDFVKDATGNDLVLTSDSNGVFFVKGLAYDLTAGTNYYLVETVAPVVNGTPYNLLQSAVMFTVTGTSFYSDPTVITSPTTPPNAAPDQIINKTGFQIPATGGLGTGLFSLGGLVLMGGALWLLRRKRNATDQE